MVDTVPQFDPLGFPRIVVEAVRHSCAAAILDHTTQDRRVEYRLHQAIDPARDRGDIPLKRLERICGKVATEKRLHLARTVDIAVHCQLQENVVRLLLGDSMDLLLAANLQAEFAVLEELRRGFLRAVVEVLLDLVLEGIDERGIALGGDDRQFVDIVDSRLVEFRKVLAYALGIDTKTQATPYLLPLLRSTIGLAQGANLEHIGVVPALAQCRVGEYEADRLLETEQPLLVLENQVVCRDIVGIGLAPLDLTIDRTPALVDREIAGVGAVRLDGGQIGIIVRVVQIEVLVEQGQVFLLEYLTILAQLLIALGIVEAIVGHLVEEEKRERLDSALEIAALLTEMGADSLAYLDTNLVLLRHIAYGTIDRQFDTIGEDYPIPFGLNLGNADTAILRELVGAVVEVVADTEGGSLPLDSTAGKLVLVLDACLRGFVLGKDNILEVEVAVGTLDILQLEADDLYLLDQFLVERIEGVKDIDGVMHILVGGGIVEREERVELGECLLRGGTAHLLRLVEDDNRAVGGNDIDRAARAELVAAREDDTRGFVAGTVLERSVERLRIDNHDGYIVARREGLYVLQVLGIVDEIACFLMVLLHEVVDCDIEGLLDALTDSDTRHNNNELGPTVTLVQLEHSLDIDIGLTRTRLHLDIEGDTPVPIGKRRREVEVVGLLHAMEIGKQGIVVEQDRTIAIAVLSIDIAYLCHLLQLAVALVHKPPLVDDILAQRLIALTGKDTHRTVDSVGLVGLYFELEMHYEYGI